MSVNPYYFPFEQINKDQLIPAETYYIQLKDNVIADYTKKHRKLPVSKLKGDFIRLQTFDNNVTSTEYAVFKKITIMNKSYKPADCRFMMALYPKGHVATTDCDDFKDKDKEVYLPVNRWQFGIPTEKSLVSKRAFSKINTTRFDGAEHLITSMYHNSVARGVKNKKNTKVRRNKKIGRNKKKKTRKNTKH